MEAGEQEVDLPDAVPDPTLERLAPELEVPTPPLEPALLAHPQPAQPSCSNVSLCTLLEYRRQREKLSFEVGFISPGWGLSKDSAEQQQQQQGRSWVSCRAPLARTSLATCLGVGVVVAAA